MQVARALLLSGLFGVASCTMRKADVWIVDGSTADLLTFGIGRDRPEAEPVYSLNQIVVRKCTTEAGRETEVVWSVARESAFEGQPPTRIRYGDQPPGFRTLESPLRLESGCYDVHVSGEGVGAVLRFVVSAGRVVSQQYRRPGL